jgi:hypothetical protein
MAIDTALRTSGGAVVAGASTPARLVPARGLDAVAADQDKDSAAAGSSPAPLRGKSNAAVGGAHQDSVARAQQALDYLERVAGQLENLKGEISAKLSGASGSQVRVQPRAQQRSQQLDTSVRQLTSTLAARQSSAGGGVDANLNFNGQPAQQRFRVRGLDIDSLQQSAPTTVAFSIGGIGGPQLAAAIGTDQSSEEIARAIDRAVAPLGVRASLDNGSLVFSTPEANWPAVRDSIAVSGRGRVATDEVAPALAPQQWPIGTGSSNGGGNADALRQSLREVVQALERVRRSQDAASSALSSASVQVSVEATPPPEVNMAADDFASAAANTNYDSLVALSSALVGVSRERVLALLGLR